MFFDCCLRPSVILWWIEQRYASYAFVLSLLQPWRAVKTRVRVLSRVNERLCKKKGVVKSLALNGKMSFVRTTWRRVVVFADWSLTGSWSSINWVYAAYTSCSSDPASNRFGTLAIVRAIGIRFRPETLIFQFTSLVYKCTVQKFVSYMLNQLCFGFCLYLEEYLCGYLISVKWRIYKYLFLMSFGWRQQFGLLLHLYFNRGFKL